MDEDIEELKQTLITRYIEACHDIHINFLRPIKKDMYLCSTKCCEDETVSMADHMECVLKCYLKTSGAEYYIISTLNDIKRRYNTCISKCDSGSGYSVLEDDDEGSDGEISAEDLREESFAEQPDPDHVMNMWFADLDKSDLEYEDEETPEDKIDYKDRDTCTRLCTKDYLRVMNMTLEEMRRDLAATAIAKSEQASFYYDWSRACDPTLPY